MDMINGIAQASMEMASARVATAAQFAVLKNVMEAQKDTMELLLNSMGMGRNVSIQA